MNTTYRITKLENGNFVIGKGPVAFELDAKASLSKSLGELFDQAEDRYKAVHQNFSRQEYGSSKFTGLKP